MKQLFSQRGQSLLEVLFVTAFVSVALVAVLSTIIASLQNSRTALEQSRARQLGQQPLEWLRRERDNLGWSAFESSLPSVGVTTTYCLDDVPATIATLSQQQGACTTETVSNTAFTRELTLERVSTTELHATSIIRRPDRSGQIETTIELTLTEWQ